MNAEYKPRHIYKVKAKHIRRFGAIVAKLNELMSEIREYNKDAELLVLAGEDPALVLVDAKYAECPKVNESSVDKDVAKRAAWFEKHGCDGADLVASRGLVP